MDAVIFDLFGTLVPNLDPRQLRSSLKEIARVLGADPAHFWDEWGKGFRGRMEGSIPDGDEQFLPITRALGISPPQVAFREASRLRRSFMRDALVPKPGALECLDALVARGSGLALATDCSTETPALLDATQLGGYFQVRACSSELGVSKPDAAVYNHALDSLGLPGERCLYVGDGNSEELPGAKRCGMTTVWVDNGAEQHFKDRFVPEGDYRVRDLREIPGIFDELQRHR